MSVRGIEIHNGYLNLPEGMPQTLHMGTWASPLTQGEAAQIVVSAVISATVLGGDVTAGSFIVTISESMAGPPGGYSIPTGLKARVNIEADVAITLGFARGMQIEIDMQDGSSVEYGWDALYISMYQHAGATSTGNTAAIEIRSYLAGTIGLYYFMYMQENIAALMTGAFYVRVAVDMTHLFYLFPAVTSAWAQTSTPSLENGWIKVSLAGPERWIKLYSTAPP